MGSTEAFANAPIFDAAGLLQISPCASHPDLCERGYRTFHRLVANERVQGHELAALAIGRLGARAVGIVHDDDAFGTVVADYFTDGFEQQGGTISGRRSSTPARSTRLPWRPRWPSSTPTCSCSPSTATKVASSPAAARDSGMRTPFLGTDGLKTSFFLGGGDDRGEAYHTHSGADMRRLPVGT